MSLQSTARAAFSAIKTAHAEAVVEVVSAGRTAEGVRDSKSDASASDVFGESGVTSGRVWVDASEIDEPQRGGKIKVDGVDVIVGTVKTDPAGAILSITYTYTNPIT